MHAATSRRKIKLIQVFTHEKAGNKSKPVGIDFDIEEEWNNLLDNLQGDTEIENRCKEITPDNIRYEIACEIIRSHISHFDYYAALTVAKASNSLFDKRLIQLLEAGVYRSSLCFNDAKRLASSTGYVFDTIESGDAREIFEYILYLRIKKERGELNEFTRAISPTLTSLFVAYLKNVHNFNIYKFCEYDQKNDYYRLLRKKILPEELLNIYDTEFNGLFKDSPLAFSNILPMVNYYCSKDERYYDDYRKAKRLRDFEEDVRNTAAHQMIGLTEQRLKEIYGFSSDGILESIKYFFMVSFRQYSSKINWDSYKEFNEFIIKLLN